MNDSKNLKELQQQIVQLIKDMVRDIGRPDLFREPLVGFASARDPLLMNVKEVVGPWHEYPENLLPGAKTVIAYSVPFTREIAMEPGNAEFASIVWSRTYDLINNNFDIISDAVSDLLRANGFEARGFQATHNWDPVAMVAVWSHRTMAYAAGLGSFGRNRILITEKGSAVRYCSIVTTAEFEPSGPYTGPTCLGDHGCTICIDTCPVNALTRWLEGGKADCFNLQSKYHDEVLRKYSEDISLTCGKCISACPLSYIE